MSGDVLSKQERVKIRAVQGTMSGEGPFGPVLVAVIS
jgi:hypothetical protein